VSLARPWLNGYHGVVRAERRGERSEQCAAECAGGPSRASIVRARGGCRLEGLSRGWLGQCARRRGTRAGRARGQGACSKTLAHSMVVMLVRVKSERLSHKEKWYEAASVNCQSKVPSESLK
jgi:hypothetical protein